MTTLVENNLNSPIPIKLTGDETVEPVGDKSDRTNVVERIMLVTETNSKIRKPKIYKEAIFDPIHAQ